MSRIIHRGELKKWDDDRGFGFIKPNDNTRTVFIHISALKRMPRRPVVGDTITYEVVEETNGKIRAVHASTEGISIQNQQRTSQKYSHKPGYDIAMRVVIISLFYWLSVAYLSSYNQIVQVHHHQYLLP